MSRLRGKLEREPSEPKIIRTFQGVGYMLTADETIRDEANEVAAVSTDSQAVERAEEAPALDVTA